jgi:hypothetical protein
MRNLLIDFWEDLLSLGGTLLGWEPLQPTALAALALLVLVELMLYTVVLNLPPS